MEMRIKICNGWGVCGKGITSCCHHCSKEVTCVCACTFVEEQCGYVKEITIAPVVTPPPTEEELKPGTRVRVTNKYVGEWNTRDKQIEFCNEGTIVRKASYHYEELGRETTWFNVSFDKKVSDTDYISIWDCAISELEVIK